MSRMTQRKPISREMRLVAAFVVGMVTILMMPVSANASGLANARAAGMAGAYTSLAKGYYCPAFNPANLGLTAYQMRGIQLFGVGLSINNNSLTLDDYNHYTGARLSEYEKRDLLSKIPAEGLKVSADGEATALAFGMGSLAISLSATGAAEINLGRTAVELLLNGNAIADTVSLDGIYGEGYGLASLNVAYGRPLYKSGDRQLAVGATVRLLKGLGFEQVTEANGQAVTLAAGIDGAGNLVARSAAGGSGYGLDIGATLQISRNYTAGITLFNSLSAIRWNDNTKEHRFTFYFDSLTAADMSDESIVATTDTTMEINPFTTHLPSTIKAGLARTTGSLLWAVDWEQGFKLGAGSSPRPRVSAGGQYHLFRFLPLRVGLAVGGKQGMTYAGGVGVEFALFHLDLAVANYNAIAGSAGKGLNVAVNSGFQF
jgi:hypothetical protein